MNGPHPAETKTHCATKLKQRLTIRTANGWKSLSRLHKLTQVTLHFVKRYLIDGGGTSAAFYDMSLSTLDPRIPTYSPHLCEQKCDEAALNDLIAAAVRGSPTQAVRRSPTHYSQMKTMLQFRPPQSPDFVNNNCFGRYMEVHRIQGRAAILTQQMAIPRLTLL